MTTSPTIAKKPRITPWFMWGMTATFFFTHYLLRVAPSVMHEPLLVDLHFADATALSIMASWFYYPYVLMQIPFGYCVEKFGPRIIVTLAISICAISTFLFAASTMPLTVNISRFILGFGAAAAFLSAVKVASNWFSPAKLALIVGLTQSLGMLGGFIGHKTMSHLISDYGWRGTLWGLGIAFGLLAAFVFIFLRNHPNLESQLQSEKKPLSHTEKKSTKLTYVLTHRLTWINALYAGCIFSPIMILGEFWGVNTIETIHHLSTRDAATVCSLIFIGWGIGGPVAGWLGGKYGRKPIMIGSSLCGLVLIPALLLIPNVPLIILMVLSFLLGFTNTGLVACYTVAGEMHDKNNAGPSIAIANMMTVLIGLLFLPLIGHLLTKMTVLPSDLSAQDFQYVMIVTLPACLIGALICSLFIKETLKK